MRARPSPLLLLIGVLLSATAAAAPISRPAELTLTARILGLYLYVPVGTYYLSVVPTATGTATVEVDEVARSIRFASDLVALPGPFSALEAGGSSAVNAITMTRLGNLSATFSVGGAAGISGEPPCPSTRACVPQTGFGGRMGVTGTLNVQLVPGVVSIPVPLGGLNVGEGGPETTLSIFTGDPAPWTIGTAQFPTGYATRTEKGGVGADTIRLVAPAYVVGLGNIVPVITTFEIKFLDGLGVPDFVLDTVPEPAPAVVALVAGAALPWRWRRTHRRSA